MTQQKPVEINMSGIPVAGIGGLGLVVVALTMTVVFPEARWLEALGVAGGGAIAVALVAIRRRHADARGGFDMPILPLTDQPATTGLTKRAMKRVAAVFAPRILPRLG